MPKIFREDDWRATVGRSMMEELERREFLSASHNQGDFFTQTNLVSDSQSVAKAAHTDVNLKNPWGLAFGAGTAFWVANNGTGTSTIYDGSGNTLLGAVTVPGADGQNGTGNPTGTVFNGGSGFTVTEAAQTGPSQFIFVNEDGIISGWSPQVDGQHAIMAVNNSAQGAIYKGATLGKIGANTFLYVADFHNGKISVFDSNFAVAHPSGTFTDSRLPAGYAPFNIQNIGGKLYVAFAQQDADKHDEVAGAGKGFVDVFDTNGNLLRRFHANSALNAPWGLAAAPRGYGKFTGDILVGQFGSGQIAAFNAKNGKFVGLLRDSRNRPIHIDGLWALAFGNGRGAGDAHTLYFTAGLNDEADGLFGKLSLHHGRSKHR